MSRESQPLVSVIVPAYNEEQFLGECLDSVLAQTYENWDLTVVNNQSKDRTLEIATRYARREPRIRVLTTPEFYPQLRNFNFAMRQISPASKYCKVVQGDTWIFPDCLRHMVAAAEAHPSVGVVSSLWLTSTRVMANSLPYPSVFMPGREAARRQLLTDEDYFGSPTTTLFRADIVRSRDPFYREGAHSADAEACFEILEKWDFSFIHQVLSFNRIDNISISTASRRLARFIVTQYLHIRRYGAMFLSPGENAAAQARLRKEYYSFLAERWFTHPAKEFRDYHRAAFATIGETLSTRLLAKHLALELLDIIGNPKRTLGRLLRNRRPPAVARPPQPPQGARIPGEPRA